MNHAIILLSLLLIVGAAFFVLSSRKEKGADFMPPLPAALRTDLWFGYFHTFDDQIAQTRDHVNIVFESGWSGAQATAASMRDHGQRTILNLSTECYDWANGAMLQRDDASDRIAATFSTLRTAGVLSQVVALYPIDEPDLTGKSDAGVLAMCATVRKAAAAFPELANVKIYVCYANKGTWPGISGADCVGMDDYPLGSGVLASPLFVKMLSLLRADQQHFVVPGGADPFRQDPEAFRRYAHNTPGCMGILAFMWAQQHPGTLAGIGTNGMADKYRALGLELTGANQKA